MRISTLAGGRPITYYLRRADQNGRTTMNITSSANKVAIDCPRCKAPHFSYQLTCKRCGVYLQREEAPVAAPANTVAVAGGILGVSTVILVVCLALHMF